MFSSRSKLQYAVLSVMKAQELLNFIPQADLEFFAAETNVNHQVKKLDGIVVFKLILFSLLKSQKSSLRIMEQLYSSLQFRLISGLENETTRYNSIRDRIATIKPVFFEKLFYNVFERFNKYFNEEHSILRYDSTMISISSNLMEWSMKVGSNPNLSWLKYTIATKGSFPCHVKVFDNSEALCEDKTIPATILENSISKSGIIVFDRGVQERKAFNEIDKANCLFVTRIKTATAYKVIKKSEPKARDKSKEQSVIINEDLEVLLKNQHGVWMQTSFRLIKATIKKSNEPIYFLTNIHYLSAKEIAFIYKQRWEIEVYFKYLKQHLNLKHLVARNQNGIKVMIYMTLILSILLLAYKKLNKIETFKIAKFRFSLDLESSVVKQIVILTGGDPNKMPHLFKDD